MVVSVASDCSERLIEPLLRAIDNCILSLLIYMTGQLHVCNACMGWNHIRHCTPCKLLVLESRRVWPLA